MDLKKVKEFIKLAKDEGVSTLKYEEKDLKISVDLQAKSIVTQAPAIHHDVKSAEAKHANVESTDQGLHTITSPFVGTFYAAPSPGAPDFVSKGTKVSKGETLCILEAMKIMNEIESDINGEIVEICVDNESLVEFGQPLFKLRV